MTNEALVCQRGQVRGRVLMGELELERFFFFRSDLSNFCASAGRLRR